MKKKTPDVDAFDSLFPVLPESYKKKVAEFEAETRARLTKDSGFDGEDLAFTIKWQTILYVYLLQLMLLKIKDEAAFAEKVSNMTCEDVERFVEYDVRSFWLRRVTDSWFRDGYGELFVQDVLFDLYMSVKSLTEKNEVIENISKYLSLIKRNIFFAFLKKYKYGDRKFRSLDGKWDEDNDD